MFKHVPNILTTIRLLLIPVIFYYALQENYIIAVVFLTLSGLTDVLDGVIARKFNFITDFGTLFDPLADKLTQVSTLIVLVIQGIIPLWILIIVIIKELLMIAGAAFLYDKNTVVGSRWYGKAATVVFYIAILISMLNKQFALGLTFDIFLYYIAVALTLFALYMYFKTFSKLKKNAQESK